MFLSEIFEQLTHGELSQLFIGGADEDGINVNSYPAMAAHVNLGLLELHKRFPIRVREINVQLYSTTTTYYLQEKFAANSGSAESPLYLLDTPNDLFKGNVLKIERVITDDPDVTDNLPLNDSSNSESNYTESYNRLRVYEPNDTNILTVFYRASHDVIPSDFSDPEVIEIDIPYSLLESLLLFIASRIFASKPTLDGQSNNAMLYLQKFEASVAKIEELSLIENTYTTNEKLDINGWV